MKLTTILLITMMPAIPCSAGVVYEIEVKAKSMGKKSNNEIMAYSYAQSGNVKQIFEEITSYAIVEGKKLKMGVAAAESGAEYGETIFLGDDDPSRIVVVDHEEKAYVVIDKAAMGAIGDRLNQADAMMQQALAGVPEDKRAMIEEMMKQRMPPSFQQQVPSLKNEVRKRNEQKNIKWRP